MAAHGFPPAEQLQKWTQELSEAAKSYDPSAGVNGLQARLNMISRAEDIVRGLTDPSDIGHVYVARVSHRMADPEC